MNRSFIRTSGGVLLRWLDEHEDRIEARNSNGVILGWYDKAANKTRSSGGLALNIGNNVAGLIPSR